MAASKKLTSRRVFVYLSIVALFVLADFELGFYIAGAAIIAVGQAIRFWATGHLEKNQKLTISGPYAHVKNPLYLGTLLILVGFCLAGASTTGRGLWVLLIVLPFGLIVYYGFYFPYKKEVEGDRLIRRFGEEAERYLREVPNLLPSIKPYPYANERWQFALVFKNSEHLTFLVIVFGFVMLFVRTHTEVPFLSSILP